MTSHSDDILDRIGFQRSDILPLLAEAGIAVGDVEFVQLQRTDWPEWKLRLAVADYLTDAEVAAAIAGPHPAGCRMRSSLCFLTGRASFTELVDLDR